ncbi:nucleotidyltransferase family protein, partial [bacterium]|nr:nucleotidyltransferase family protein [bacterium]
MRDRRELNKINFKGGFWPTRHQELLLQACLLQGKEALDAWSKWKLTADVDQLDKGSLRLIPLLYRNLQAHGVEDDLMNKFKGVYRFTLYKNHMLLHNMANVLAGFYDTGIQAMVLKGVALTLLHYKDYGLRPMSDFDVLIHEKDVTTAINILRNLHWKPWQRLPKVFTAEYLSSTKGCAFNNDRGEGLDLHWHVLLECCYKNADKDFWDGAVQTRSSDFPVFALNPTDQLLHV